MTKYDNTTTSNDDGSLRAVRLDDCAKGTFFKRKPDSNTVWVRGEYSRIDKKYYCEKHNIQYYYFDENGDKYLKGSTIVYIGFEY